MTCSWNDCGCRKQSILIINITLFSYTFVVHEYDATSFMFFMFVFSNLEKNPYVNGKKTTLMTMLGTTDVYYSGICINIFFPCLLLHFDLKKSIS